MTSGTRIDGDGCDRCPHGVATESYDGCQQCDPPPLQTGDAVWVRAVVVSVDPNATGLLPEVMTLQIHGVRSWAGKDLFGFYDLSAIRRIEGEVKP